MSIRADVTFIRTLARAPERISPRPASWQAQHRCAAQHPASSARSARASFSAFARSTTSTSSGNGAWWSVPYMASTGSSPKNGRIAVDQRVDRVAELVRRDQEVRGVAVAGRKVLGTHRRAVDAAPLEHVVIDRGRDSAPHDGVVEPVRAQDLRHLGDVPEHVRQVADAHLAAELARAGEPLLEVPPDRLAARRGTRPSAPATARSRAAPPRRARAAAARSRAGSRGSRRPSGAGRRA